MFSIIKTIAIASLLATPGDGQHLPRWVLTEQEQHALTCRQLKYKFEDMIDHEYDADFYRLPRTPIFGLTVGQPTAVNEAFHAHACEGKIHEDLLSSCEKPNDECERHIVRSLYNSGTFPKKASNKSPERYEVERKALEFQMQVGRELVRMTLDAFTKELEVRSKKQRS